MNVRIETDALEELTFMYKVVQSTTVIRDRRIIAIGAYTG